MNTGKVKHHRNSDTKTGNHNKTTALEQNLSVDESMDIAVGTVDLPKVGVRKRNTKTKGKNNSLQLKTSNVTIENEDQLCMTRAIGVSRAKLKRCTPEEWKEVTENRGKKTNLQLV